MDDPLPVQLRNLQKFRKISNFLIFESFGVIRRLKSRKSFKKKFSKFNKSSKILYFLKSKSGYKKCSKLATGYV